MLGIAAKMLGLYPGHAPANRSRRNQSETKASAEAASRHDIAHGTQDTHLEGRLNDLAARFGLALCLLGMLGLGYVVGRLSCW
jgi:hypothetical protein